MRASALRRILFFSVFTDYDLVSKGMVGGERSERRGATAQEAETGVEVEVTNIDC